MKKTKNARKPWTVQRRRPKRPMVGTDRTAESCLGEERVPPPIDPPLLSPQKLHAGCVGLLCSSPKQLSLVPSFGSPGPL